MQPNFIFDHFICLTIPSFCSLALTGARFAKRTIERCPHHCQHFVSLPPATNAWEFYPVPPEHPAALLHHGTRGGAGTKRGAADTGTVVCIVVGRWSVVDKVLLFDDSFFFFGNASCLNICSGSVFLTICLLFGSCVDQSFFWPCLNHSSSCFEQPFFLTSILLGIRSGFKKTGGGAHTIHRNIDGGQPTTTPTIAGTAARNGRDGGGTRRIAGAVQHSQKSDCYLPANHSNLETPQRRSGRGNERLQRNVGRGRRQIGRYDYCCCCYSYWYYYM